MNKNLIVSVKTLKRVSIAALVALTVLGGVSAVPTTAELSGAQPPLLGSHADSLQSSPSGASGIRI